MGMFNEITCKYPLPVEGANALVYQTKDTPEQYLKRYEIRTDGTLWNGGYQEKYTGEIRFYTNTDNGWLEFSAYFWNGWLQQLHLIENT